MLPRMSLRLLILAPTLVCLLSSCTVVTDNPTDSTSTQTAAGSNGGTEGLNQDADPSPTSGAYAGSAGKANRGSAGSAGSRTTVENTDPNDENTSTTPHRAGSGGAGPVADPPKPPPESCDLNGTCITNCLANPVTCGVETASACEFIGFTGATAQVACGQRAVIGTACCGGCGCVPVEVFFDGTYCWQGVPRCEGGALGNKMLYPHAPTTPADPSYTPPRTVPGTFYLGSGGFGGSDAQGGAAGNSSGGTSGIAGAPQGSAVAGAHTEAGNGGAAEPGVGGGAS